MKLVKELINEKFTDESDPIQDMGIGMKYTIKKFIDENDEKRIFKFDLDLDKCQWSSKISGIGALLSFVASKNNFKLVKYIVEELGGDPRCFKSLPLRWAAAVGNVNMIKYLIKHGANIYDTDSGNALDVAISYEKKKAIKYLKSLKDNRIDEKFSEDSDPVIDMGIGLHHLVDKWLKKYNRLYSQSTFSLNLNGTIDIDSFVFVDEYEVHKLEEFPDYIRFNKANYFDCSFKNLKSLKGTPRIVNGEFSCCHSKITSLEGGPILAKRYYVYDCRNLSSLRGLKTVEDFFVCFKTLIQISDVEKIIKRRDVNIKCVRLSDIGTEFLVRNKKLIKNDH